MMLDDKITRVSLLPLQLDTIHVPLGTGYNYNLVITNDRKLVLVQGTCCRTMDIEMPIDEPVAIRLRRVYNEFLILTRSGKLYRLSTPYTDLQHVVTQHPIVGLSGSHVKIYALDDHNQTLEISD